MKKFSVIIACFNSEDKLAVTLESIVDQGINEVQIIIVDGGSTDNSREIFNRYEKQIDKLISEQDRGIADAWNKGLKFATGEYVNFLNAGDFYEKNMLQRVYTNCKKLEGNFIGYGNTTLFDNYSKEFKLGKFNNRSIFLINGFGFLHPSVFFPLALINEVGYFDVNKRIAIDTDWLLKCIKCEIKFYNINSHVNMEKGGISNKYQYAAMGEYLDSLVSLRFPAYYIPLFFFIRLLGAIKLFYQTSFIKNNK